MESTLQPDIVQDILPVQDFLSEWHVRVTWIAFTTLWVFWGFSWFVRNAFGGDNTEIISSTAPAVTTETVATDTEVGATAAATTHKKQVLAAPAWSVNIFNRMNRAHNLLRELVLMLLSVLSINTFARGSTRAVMILAWIFVAFAVVYFAIEASFEHRFLRLIYTLTFYAISLAIVGCAWHQGFFV
ncbi:hypothetical protein BY458DRAFT_433206 [Sporodiniella umbellata]|nr:hypothetical protein BY458DRAFT_433206 [Sporodiniella umbellata]